MPRTRPCLFLASLVATLLVAAPALATPPSLGGLTPFPVPGGCFNAGGTGGCTVVDKQTGGQRVVTTNSIVYATGSDSVLAYARTANGTLALVDCVTATVTATCTKFDGLLTTISAVAITPDHKTLYVAGGAGANSYIIALRLNPDGAIGVRIGCLVETAGVGPKTGCIDADGLDAVKDLALAPDGLKLYSAASGPGGGVQGFLLNADGTFALVPALGGCLKPSGGSASCADSGLTQALDVEVRGTTLYATWSGSSATDSGVQWYSLATTGAIGARAGCVGDNTPLEPTCPTQVTGGMLLPHRAVVAPNGTSIAIGSERGVSVFARGTDGSIGARLSCDSIDVVPGCTPRPAELTGYDLAFSPSGDSLYIAAFTGGYWAFGLGTNGAATGLVTCASDTLVAGCAPLPTAGNAGGVAVSGDGARVYGVGSGGTAGALVTFQREVAPTCLPSSGTVPFGTASVTLTLACSDPNGDPITYAAAGNPAHGSVVVSDAGVATYTPVAGYAGTDIFTFRATDGSAASVATNATIGIVGPPGSTAPVPVGVPPVAPKSTIDAIRSPIRSAELRRFSGRAVGDRLKRVEISVVRLDHGARASRSKAACRRLLGSGRLAASKRSKKCPAAAFLTASGTGSWTFNLIRNLPKGRYVVVSRAIGAAGGEKSNSIAAHNRRTFRVR